ncbi:hypothetical protein BGW39_006776 [Mortierella sp. 14UC]|nr:hypothetical protein BGW39_006776 [Mortierella sp. 14UC]
MILYRYHALPTGDKDIVETEHRDGLEGGLVLQDGGDGFCGGVGVEKGDLGQFAGGIETELRDDGSGFVLEVEDREVGTVVD